MKFVYTDNLNRKHTVYNVVKVVVHENEKLISVYRKDKHYSLLFGYESKEDFEII